jgi:O-antigen/teichoic acid export membrane protein
MLSRIKNILERKHNVRAHFWQSMANYVQLGGGLLLGVVLARMLQPAVFGELVSISAFLSFMMIPLSFSAAQILVSDGGRTKGLFEQVMGMVWIISVAKVVVLGTYVMWEFRSGDFQRAVVGGLVGLPLALADWPSTIRSDLEGRGMFKPNFYVQLSGLATYAIVAIGLVYAGWGIYGLACGAFIAFVPQIAYYLKYTDRRLSAVSIDTGIIRKQWATGFWLWLNHIASGWFSRIDKLFLGHFGGDTQLGYYSRAYNYGPVSHMVLNSLMTNATVRGLASESNSQTRRRLFYRTMAFVACGGVANGAFWFLFAPTLVPLVFGSQWTEAVPAFKVFGWLSAAYVFSHGSATILLAEKRFRLLAIIRVLGIITLLILLMHAARDRAFNAETVAQLYLLAIFASGCVATYFSVRSIHGNLGK